MNIIRIMLAIALLNLAQAKSMEDQPEERDIKIEIVTAVDIWIIAQLDEGCDLDDSIRCPLRDIHDGTLLEIAAIGGNINTIRGLLLRGAKVTARALGAAIGRGHRGILKLLISHLQDRSYLQVAFDSVSWGRNTGCLEEMLENGVDINYCPPGGWTVLYKAALWTNLPLLQFLIAHGADVNIPNCMGITPLEAAIGSYKRAKKEGSIAIKEQQVIDELIKHGAQSKRTRCAIM